MIRLRACATLPAMTSSREAAIHAGACFGLDWRSAKEGGRNEVGGEQGRRGREREGVRVVR
eukprot:3671736-Rhodomonas_salina.2